MSDTPVLVSLVVATYAPGDAINRLVDSLDRQTLPQEQFEVIFVDDGSPDDTVQRLHAIASTRSNVAVLQIENSGWPSKPRNVGLRHARGEYVMFVDHDDSIYPDGLRRACEYAAQTGADIVSPKESKTNDVWWGMSSLTAGNISDILHEERIERLLPMVPHKFYRRSLLLDQGIEFPEGPRLLWEDWYINVGAYRHAKTVAVLADTPVYLWHSSDTNSSHTFNPVRADFWDRLEQMLEYVDSTLDEGDYQHDRLVLLTHNVRTRVIDRCARLIMNDEIDDRAAKERALTRSGQLLERYCSPEVFAALPKKHQGLAVLIQQQRPDLVASFHRADLALGASTQVTELSWVDGGLQLETTTSWYAKNAAAPGFDLGSGRVLRVVAPEVRAAMPSELLDYTDDLSRVRTDVAVRSREGYVSWQLPYQGEAARFETHELMGLVLQSSGRVTLDIDAAALGQPLEASVWDLRARTEWVGMERKGALGYQGAARPALMNQRAAVAYMNKSEGLTVDLAGKLRTLATDAKPRGQAGAVAALSVGLDNIFAPWPADLPANVVAIADFVDLAALAEPAIQSLAEIGDLHARVVADNAGVRLVGGANLGPGAYVIYAKRDGKLERTRTRLTVDPGGQATFS